MSSGINLFILFCMAGAINLCSRSPCSACMLHEDAEVPAAVFALLEEAEVDLDQVGVT